MASDSIASGDGGAVPDTAKALFSQVTTNLSDEIAGADFQKLADLVAPAGLSDDERRVWLDDLGNKDRNRENQLAQLRDEIRDSQEKIGLNNELFEQSREAVRQLELRIATLQGRREEMQLEIAQLDQRINQRQSQIDDLNKRLGN